MIVKKAVFVKSCADTGAFAGDLPSVCVAGRSNVGKSTFINTLLGVKLARTSSEPGRTRLINVFLVNDQFYVADLPGYGFARASKAERTKWSEMAEGYFVGAKGLRHTLVLCDIRHEPSALDRQMLDYLYYYKLPFTVLASKCDKLSKAQTGVRVQQTAAALGIGRDDVIPVSQKGDGRSEVLNLIERVVTNIPLR